MKRNGKLRRDPRNARKHGDRNKQMIRESLEAVGPLRSIGVDGDNIIRAGNGVFEQAEALGLRVRVVDAKPNELIAVRRPDLKGKKAVEAALYDNRTGEMSEWDTDVLTEIARNDGDLVGRLFEGDREIMEAIAPKSEVEDAEPQIDRADELRKKWGTATGQLWQLGEHRLLCGDSTKREDVERVMQGQKADCVFTSPPYATGIEYGVYIDTIQNLRAMLPKLASIWKSTIVLGGYAVVNFGDIASNRTASETVEPCEYPMALEYWPVFRSEGWRLWTRRVWCKPNARVHAPWTIQSNRAATDWEHVWTWVQTGKPIDIRNGAIDRAGWFDTTKDAGVEIGKNVHGAGMALGCATRMIEVHSRRNTFIHEPFTGTGTTIIACEKLGRKCRAIEISPAYVAVTLQRFLDATGKTPELMDDGNEKKARKRKVAPTARK